MQPLLNIAVRAARRAGDIIVRAIPRLESVEIHTKGRNDYVSEVDRQGLVAKRKNGIRMIHKYTDFTDSN